MTEIILLGIIGFTLLIEINVFLYCWGRVSLIQERS